MTTFIEHPDGPIEVNANGGKHSAIEERYDLLPFHAEEAMAIVFAAGGKKYGDWNWLLLDQNDMLNHIQRHLTKLKMGDTSEDHAVNILCRAAMYVHLRKVAQLKAIADG